MQRGEIRGPAAITSPKPPDCAVLRLHLGYAAACLGSDNIPIHRFPIAKLRSLLPAPPVHAPFALDSAQTGVVTLLQRGYPSAGGYSAPQLVLTDGPSRPKRRDAIAKGGPRAKSHRHTIVAALLCFALLCPLTATAQADLFQRPVVAADLTRFSPQSVVRSEYRVTPNIRGLAVSLAARYDNVHARLPRFSVTLPGVGKRVVQIHKFEPRGGFEVDDQGNHVIPPGTRTEDLGFYVYGYARDIELSLNAEQGRLFGSITGQFGQAGQAWELRTSELGPVLRDIDSRRVPRHAEASGDKTLAPPGPVQGEPELLPAFAPIDPSPSLAKATTWIDVLVVHSQSAASQIGTTAINELITGSIDDMQTALENSQVGGVRLRNVMPGGQVTSGVGYIEPPTGPDHEARFRAHRLWARSSSQVSALRNQYEADLVVLVVADDGYCGLAYTQRPNCARDDDDPRCGVGSDYQDFAFSVVSAGQSCARPTLTFAHEVGHMFGLEHDPLHGINPSDRASFVWSYAHLLSSPVASARTIMSYEVPKTCQYGCPITLHYSNPAVNFNSLLPAAHPTGNDVFDQDLRRRFNARTIALLAPEMGNFRGEPQFIDRIFLGGFDPLPDFECQSTHHPSCPL